HFERLLSSQRLTPENASFVVSSSLIKMFDISWRPDGIRAHENNRGHEILQQTNCGSNNSIYACVRARHK
ncbi:MAG: hypothetical protein AAFY76_24315, partial [Cyanobacteria bacterium J06649_11]